ncbi:hypothetical protein [Desulfosoma caldarium]|uniref:Uncharacterized protein n=1 Tax=Desulfosoma caldarium TaxID=610254 RepID=A0A3N1ULS9_9BACT|nr:hypothetical protein [Desulfosoma caldarium]ROQ92174.1 hypothetical protein EDC27_1863 [Desulfosoma caldarium]
MIDRREVIGFSQRVRLEWFEQTANLVFAGHDKAAINEALQELLKDKVSVGGNAKGCNRNKVISILRRVWVSPPDEIIPLRDDGLAFLSTQCSSLSPHQLSVALHWGLVMAVYPFWSSVATQTGRLLRLQGFAAAAQVQRRVREQYGERETVFRATRRVLRSYLDWGVLQKTGTKGVYAAGTTIAIDDFRLVAWLAEASLHARPNGAAPLRELIDSPSLFPFRIKPVQAEIIEAASTRLDIFRHGLDDDLVMLR